MERGVDGSAPEIPCDVDASVDFPVLYSPSTGSHHTVKRRHHHSVKNTVCPEPVDEGVQHEKESKGSVGRGNEDANSSIPGFWTECVEHIIAFSFRDDYISVLKGMPTIDAVRRCVTEKKGLQLPDSDGP